MWKLTIEDDEGKRIVLPLTRDAYAIGRDDGSTIRLTERNISRRHAVLRLAEPGWALHDEQSYNGSYVNGMRVVGQAPLHHGDLVQLGDYRLELIDEAQVLEGATVPAACSGSASASYDRLVALSGPDEGHEWPLGDATVTIGRDEATAVHLLDPSVSREHAEIHPVGGGRYELVDKDSRAGLRVNGVSLRRALLEAGDVIDLGDARLKFLPAGHASPGALADPTLAPPPPSVTEPAIGMPEPNPDTDSPASISTPPGPRSVPRAGLVAAAAGVGLLLVGGWLALRPARREPPSVEALGDPRAAAASSAPTPTAATAPLAAAPIFAPAEAAPSPANPTPPPAAPADPTRAVAPPTGRAARAAAAKAQATDARTTPPPPAATTTAAAKQDDLALQGREGEARLKASLERRVYAGRGSIEDIKMLRAICKHLGDRACSDKATQLLAAAQNR